MINIDLKNSISVNEDAKSLFVTFEYDPITVQKIKSIKPRVWHNSIKAWELPQSSIKELIDMFGVNTLNIHNDVNLNYTYSDNSKIEKSNDCISENSNDKWQYFNPLLHNLSDDIRQFTIEVLKQVPKYFYEVPASSTGKYHPSYALGEGGLLRHTMAAGLIALDLFRNDTMCGVFSDREKSLMLSAIILHDTLKSGLDKSKYTVSNHPILASDFIKSVKQDILPLEDVDVIASCISTHMGQWNTDYKTNKEIMDKPSNEMQKFVHICDYLASRKIIEINFDAVS